ncbi:MAG: hypothetical protein M1358_07190 [Chloroflexi bacterium]|nr:hypothetical protein [Chloroflexota bacterium]
MHLLEAFEKFPHIAQPIIYKSDALRLGQRFTDAAREELKSRDDIVFKGFWLFSYDRGKSVVYEDKIPLHFYVEDGTADGTIIQTRTYDDSPYVVDFVEGEFVFYYRVDPSERLRLGKIRFDPLPRYFNRQIDGVPMASIVQTNADMLFVTVSKYCEFFSLGKQCLYCDLTVHAGSQKKGGEAMILRKQAEQVADVLEVALHERRFRHLFLTAGTITSSQDGKSDVDRWCEFLNTIRKRLHVWYPTNFQVAAQDDEGWRRLHDTGVPSVMPNIEVWDKGLFEIMCPGKASVVGYDDWIKRTIRAVDFWGPGNVIPSFVPGVEMARPMGFQTVEEAVQSTAGGYNFLMSHGVLPRQGGFWCVEGDSKLAGQEPPPLEYFLRIGEEFLKARERHGFTSPMFNMCRVCCENGTEYDWEYWHGSGLASRKAELAEQQPAVNVN